MEMATKSYWSKQGEVMCANCFHCKKYRINGSDYVKCDKDLWPKGGAGPRVYKLDNVFFRRLDECPEYEEG